MTKVKSGRKKSCTNCGLLKSIGHKSINRLNFVDMYSAGYGFCTWKPEENDLPVSWACKLTKHIINSLHLPIVKRVIKRRYGDPDFYCPKWKPEKVCVCSDRFTTKDVNRNGFCRWCHGFVDDEGSRGSSPYRYNRSKELPKEDGMYWRQEVYGPGAVGFRKIVYLHREEIHDGVSVFCDGWLINRKIKYRWTGPVEAPEDYREEDYREEDYHEEQKEW